MPTLFGDEVMNKCVLSLGCHGDRLPNEDSRCDLPSSCIRSDDDWKVLTGCWRSFPKACLLGSAFCPLCKETLVDQLQQLSITAKEAITSVYPQKPTTSPPEQLTKIERDSFNKVPPLSSNEKASSIKSINETIFKLNPAAPRNQSNKKRQTQETPKTSKKKSRTTPPSQATSEPQASMKSQTQSKAPMQSGATPQSQ